MPTNIQGNVDDLAGANVVSGSFIRFQLRGTNGNQPRVNGTAIIAQGIGAGQGYFFDFNPDASGNITGSLYSTRDAAGSGNGEIEVGGSRLSVWYEMSLWRNGKKLSSIHCHARNGVTLDISNVTPISVNPAATAPTGDTTYLRLDGGNNPIASLVVTGNESVGGTLGVTGAQTGSSLTLSGFISVGKYVRDCRQDGVVADGATDDSTALNNCLANAYANGQSVQLPSGKIKVNTSINATNKPGMNISGVGQHQDYGTDVLTQNYGITQTEIMCNTGNICWDSTGSGRQTLSNFHLRIANSYSNPSTVGALFGRDNAVSNGSASGSGTYCFSEMNILNKFGVYADTRPAATAVGSVGIYNVGAEQFVIMGGDYIADMPVFMSATNDLGLTSSYQTILTGCPASMAAVQVGWGARFQPWTKSAFDLRGPIDFEFSADIELLNGSIGTNHNACFVFNGAIASNVFLRGQCEGFDSAITINSTSADHITAEMGMVNPVAGLVGITAGVPVTNSIFSILQRNGTPQPFINVNTGATTMKGCQIFLGGLAGSGPQASVVTLTESVIFAPGLTDTTVNTWAGASQYDLWNDSGRSILGPITFNGPSNNVGQASIIVASGAINTAETVIVKSAAIAANRIIAGTVIRVFLEGTCTATAGNTSTFQIRIGSAGTIADTLVFSGVTAVSAVTGTAVPFSAILEMTVRTVGAAATAIGYLTVLTTGGTSTGISVVPVQIILASMTTFNTTTALNIISATYKSAATTTTSTFQQAYVEVVYQ